MPVNGPNTGFIIVGADGGPNNQDLGNRYVSKDYLTSAYGNLIPDLKAPGLYAWGYNAFGGLGLNSTTARSSPVQVGSLTNWKSMSCGQGHTLSVKTDGTLWSWGWNSYGELGSNSTTNRSSPLQVGTLTDWKSVSTSYVSSFAIKDNGGLWSWGRGLNGILGSGSTANRSSPVRVGALSDWKQISAGGSHAAAIKNDGGLWTWGNNNNGQLGSGLARSSPARVGALSDWKLVSCGEYHTLATKVDGTLWAWGLNLSGQVGDNSTTTKSSPVWIGNQTDWKLAAAGGTSGSSLAIKYNGTLWSWGHNAYGQLGLGDITNRSSPVQVGTLTNWKDVTTTAFRHTVSLKTDGTLWSWGRNNVGQLGQNDITPRSSPVQIGSLTTWRTIHKAQSTEFSMAISDQYQY